MACATTRRRRCAEAKGLKVVMNRCPKIEYGRLSSEIAWMGVNSRTLSSKRTKLPGGVQRLSLARVTSAGGEITGDAGRREDWPVTGPAPGGTA